MQKLLLCLFFVLFTFNLSADSSLDDPRSQIKITSFSSIAKTTPTEQGLTSEAPLLQAQASGLLPEEIGGYACNVSHTPNDEVKWSINLYNLNNGLHSVKTIFSTNKNKNIQSVACTPNGRYILFSMKDSPRGDYEIYSMDLTDTEVVQLTTNDTDDVDVTMSEDGFTRAWQSRLSDGRQAINLRTYSSPTDYSDRTLASASPFVQPSLSPNGDWLVLLQLKNNFILNRYNIKSNSWLSIKSVPRRIKMYHPTISDDGNKVGWLERKNQSLFFMKDIENNSAQIVLNIPTGISHPTISHDGKWLSYGVNDEEGGKSQLTYLASGETVQLGDPLSSGGRYLATSWMGRFVTEDGSSNGYGGCVTIGMPEAGTRAYFDSSSSSKSRTYLEVTELNEKFIDLERYDSTEVLYERRFLIQSNQRYQTHLKVTNLSTGLSYKSEDSPPIRDYKWGLVCLGQKFDDAEVASINTQFNGYKTVVFLHTEDGETFPIRNDISTGIYTDHLLWIDQVDISEYGY
ncbi:hypothetical protein [Leucothrix mucor]|uniref:hypothetical protein n=1 Tax=Leucothrix mucor TaxID=45248 RepID=UPI0003B3F650|nr:hypothetical protein [Leucothrix mucor]